MATGVVAFQFPKTTVIASVFCTANSPSAEKDQKQDRLDEPHGTLDFTA